MAKYKVGGLQLVFSDLESGLWYDHDKKEYHPTGWGITIKLLWGKMIRPIPCIHKLSYWKWLFKGMPDNSYNPWKGGDYLYILRIPFFIFPFLSVALGKLGFYIGCKTFAIEEKHRGDDRYGRWVHEDEIGTSEDPCLFLQISASSRSTRWS